MIEETKTDSRLYFEQKFETHLAYVDQYLNYTAFDMPLYQAWFKARFAGYYNPVKFNLLVSKMKELNDIYMQKYTYL